MKTLLKSYFFLAAALMGLSSCATFNVSYLKSSDLQTKMTKPFILVKDSLSPVQYGNSGGDPNIFMNSLSQSISNCLSQNKINNTLKIVSSVYTLESSQDLTLQIENYAPDVIMNVKREQSTLVAGINYSSYNGGIYSITLTMPGTHKPFWKAVIQSSDETYAQVSDYETLAKQVVDKMKADGIL